jgi:hypothetical protein
VGNVVLERTGDDGTAGGSSQSAPMAGLDAFDPL